MATLWNRIESGHGPAEGGRRTEMSGIDSPDGTIRGDKCSDRRKSGVVRAACPHQTFPTLRAREGLTWGGADGNGRRRKRPRYGRGEAGGQERPQREAARSGHGPGRAARNVRRVFRLEADRIVRARRWRPELAGVALRRSGQIWPRGSGGQNRPRAACRSSQTRRPHSHSIVPGGFEVMS